MRVKKTNANLPKRTGNLTKWHQLLAEFARSDAEKVELIPDQGEYKNIKIAQSVACTAIRRYGFNMRTVRTDGRLYLVKKLTGGEIDALQV